VDDEALARQLQSQLDREEGLPDLVVPSSPPSLLHHHRRRRF
jgi:hypothetical protein